MPIKCLQSDWGGEFRSFNTFLNLEGIRFRHNCPHTHHQNGVVERKHRHIVETGLTLLAQASMPLSFWWEAFLTTSFLINRMPTTVLNNLSPFEKLYHLVPDYSFLKVFGCACYHLLRPYSKHKSNFHTDQCLFIGYSPIHKGYKCLHKSGRVYVARTVTFDENKFPYKDLFPVTTHDSSETFPSQTSVKFPLHTLFMLFHLEIQTISQQNLNQHLSLTLDPLSPNIIILHLNSKIINPHLLHSPLTLLYNLFPHMPLNHLVTLW